MSTKNTDDNGPNHTTETLAHHTHQISNLFQQMLATNQRITEITEPGTPNPRFSAWLTSEIDRIDRRINSLAIDIGAMNPAGAIEVANTLDDMRRRIEDIETAANDKYRNWERVSNVRFEHVADDIARLDNRTDQLGRRIRKARKLIRQHIGHGHTI